MSPTHFYVTDLDIAVFILLLINAILLFSGMGRFAVYNAVDSVLHLFFPKLSLKYNYRKFYPGFIKNASGETYSTFRTSRDEYFPVYGPFHQRFGDFLWRFPWFSVTLFVMLGPFVLGVLEPYFQSFMKLLHSAYPGLPLAVFKPSSSLLFRIFMILFLLPFSSLHTTQVSAYAVVIYPFMVLLKSISFSFRYLKDFIPAVIFTCLFVILFLMEVLLIYVGFLPMFHQGLTPFIESAPGLKQFIFWYPIKFKVFLDLVLVPLVVVVPLVTTIGSYILAKHDEQNPADTTSTTDNTNYLVLFYKTGISYLYGPLLGAFFPRLKAESKVIRDERKINEILVIGMYLESGVCIAGTGFAYLTIAKSSHIAPSGIIMGMLVLLLFVPLIVFSSSGFQAFFLDKAVLRWASIRQKFIGRQEKVNA